MKIDLVPTISKTMREAIISNLDKMSNRDVISTAMAIMATGNYIFNEEELNACFQCCKSKYDVDNISILKHFIYDCFSYETKSGIDKGDINETN